MNIDEITFLAMIYRINVITMMAGVDLLTVVAIATKVSWVFFEGN